jgi:hypothetical protein
MIRFTEDLKKNVRLYKEFQIGYPANNQFEKIVYFKDWLIGDFVCSFFPEVKKDYDIGDEVYYISSHTLCYATIRHLSQYYAKLNIGIWVERTSLVPYKWWILKKNCRLAILEFCKCAKRLRIYYDVRNIISKMIWESRLDYVWL